MKRRHAKKDAARDSFPLQLQNDSTYDPLQLQNDSTDIIGKYLLFANDTSFRESFLDAKKDWRCLPKEDQTKVYPRRVQGW